jgi:hypothetical protein
MSIQRVPHATGASAYLTGCIGNRRFRKEDLQAPNMSHTQWALSAKKTYDHPACPPRNGLASSPHQWVVASGPFQGQQLPACVRVTTAENSGVSM